MSIHGSTKTEPALLTIFGITGDLTRIKLLPALYQLELKNQLPDEFFIIGITRRDISMKDLKASLLQEIQKTGEKPNNKVVDTLLGRFSVGKFEITKPSDYPKLRHYLDSIEEKRGVCFNRLFYLAIPPTLFESVIDLLGKGGLHLGCQHERMQGRLLIEKPFGFDFRSAQNLIATINNYFKEDQVYRIDHYLAKETVLNILKFRFENPLIEAIWNNSTIDHVQITAAENIGIGSRVNFFEQTGALRDMIQSHLLQILALVAMEKPKSEKSSAIHMARQSVFDALVPIPVNLVDTLTVRGQYTANRIGTKAFSSYRDKVANQKSTTETYAALEVQINNPRWKNVPFLIRAGKRLPQKVTDITVVFKSPSSHSNINTLTIRIHPVEGISLDLYVKKPGLIDTLENAQMQFCYDQAKSGEHLDAHARLILNAAQGDQTLFPSSKEVMSSWKYIEPILRHWQSSDTSLNFYKAGTWGPDKADKLAQSLGSQWLAANVNVCKPGNTLTQ